MLRSKTALMAALLLLLPAFSALAVGQGRMQATVVDENGQPLADVTVRVSMDLIGFDKTLTTNKKGSFTLAVVDATRPYAIQFEKEGYRPVQEQVKLESGGLTKKEFMVPSLESAPMPSSGEEVAAVTGRNKAVKAYNEGVTQVQAGDLAAAKVAFLEAVEIDAEMTQPYGALAGIYLDEESYAEAVEMSEKLLALKPDDPRALQVIFDAQTALGNTEEAQVALDKLSALDTGGRDAAVRIFNMGADSIRAGDAAAALAHFEKAAELDPELAPAHAALAGLYLDAGDHVKAIASAEMALDLDPDLMQVQKVRYEGYRRTGDEAKAKEVFEEMAAGDPDGLAETLYRNGEEAFNAGNSAAAKLAFKQALEANPEYARAHYMLGLVFVNMGDGTKAKEHFQKFIQMAPDDPEVATAKEMIQYAG